MKKLSSLKLWIAEDELEKATKQFELANDLILTLYKRTLNKTEVIQDYHKALKRLDQAEYDLDQLL